MPTTEALYYISHQLNIYWGLLMFILGIIGSIWNISIFRHYAFRSSSCSTYMLIGSIASLIEILIGLSNRIIDQGFQLHWTAESIVWCKIQSYISQCASLSTLSCLLLSVIDRFFSTCQQIKWRHLSSVYTARQISSLVILFWMCISIPTLIYKKPLQSVLNHRSCLDTSIIWSRILRYCFHICCYGIFPWLLMSVFAYFTLKNIRQKRTRRTGALPSFISTRMARLDSQLTSMLFVQIIVCTISSIPFCVQIIYSNVTERLEKSAHRQAQEHLFQQIVHLNFHLNFISAFYVHYYSSKIFRKVARQVLRNCFQKRENPSRQLTIVHHHDTDNHVPKRQAQVFLIQSPCLVSPI